MPGGLSLIDVAPLLEGERPARLGVAEEIRQACSETGFFAVIGHGVPEELVSRTRQAAADFFNAETAVKEAVRRPPEKISRGWNPPLDRALAKTLGEEAPPDLQEAFAMGPPEHGSDIAEGSGRLLFAPNRWPDIAGFRQTLLEFYDAMSRLSQSMMRGFALALDLDEHFFDDKMSRHCSVVRLVRYLPIPAQQNQLRAGAHTDYGTFTLLRGDNVAGGLQIHDVDNTWRDVETPENGFICNIGDAMHRWTGGRFRSTLHRVATPDSPSERISLVYFHQPNHDARLDGIEPAAVNRPAPTFGEHYLEKIARATGRQPEPAGGDAG